MRKLAAAFVAGMLFVPAFACVLAWLGAWSVDATATPPAWEQALAREADAPQRHRAGGANALSVSGTLASIQSTRMTVSGSPVAWSRSRARKA